MTVLLGNLSPEMTLMILAIEYVIATAYPNYVVEEAASKYESHIDFLWYVDTLPELLLML